MTSVETGCGFPLDRMNAKVADVSASGLVHQRSVLAISLTVIAVSVVAIKVAI